MNASGIGFSEKGVPAPRSVHARLFINGEYNGIFALTEQIDGRFTRENFEDGTETSIRRSGLSDRMANPEVMASTYTH